MLFCFLPVPDEVRPGSTSCWYLLLDDSPTWKLLFLLPSPPFQFLPLPPPPSFRFLTNCWIIHYNGSYCSSCIWYALMVCAASVGRLGSPDWVGCLIGLAFPSSIRCHIGWFSSLVSVSVEGIGKGYPQRCAL
ncbi:hypothetical protein SORBI_3002G018166 [Sorghum bicolor]|uniref:Uncharacterized protein n=1 Tax=Sorghum bicolor TaxID=4558 RepID=A0A1W0W1X0_SORBI|nr:hypothetical protein SORBI_3002G018166 [Sorghum bicolor]